MKKEYLPTSTRILAVGLILLYVCVVFYDFCVTQSDISNADNTTESQHVVYENAEGKCTVSNQQGPRQTGYYQHAFCQNYIYFSYSKDSCVDAYNHMGEFQFTITVPDYPKGVVSICCLEDKLYIQGKTGAVYVFDQQSEMQYMTQDTANASGYTANWFRERNKAENMKVTKEFVYLLDENGEINLQIPTPDKVGDKISVLAFTPFTQVPVLVMGIVLLLYFCIKVAIRKHREETDDPRRKLHDFT